MKLAIEKLSPIPGRAIFWNNFHVVSRITVLMVAFLYVIGAGFGFLQFGLPGWVSLIAFAIGFAAQVRISTPIAVGISLRRLRYNGTLMYARLPESDERKHAREWITDIPPRYRRTLQWVGAIQPKIDELLKELPESADRVTLFIGRDPEGNYAAKVYHACNSLVCKDFSKHLRSYEEARDGAVNWGGL